MILVEKNQPIYVFFGSEGRQEVEPFDGVEPFSLVVFSVFSLLTSDIFSTFVLKLE